MKKFLAVLILICIAGAFCGGYFVGVTYPVNFAEKIATISQKKPEKEETAPVDAVKDTTVDDIISSMTLDEMVYQMLFVTPESITGMGTVIRAGDTTREALEKYPVGGIVYFDQNFEDREQTIEMLKNTQIFSEIPVFTGVDEEGGRVMRLGDNSNMGATQHPPMAEVADAKQAENIGKTLSYDLSGLGFNVDFAPVADVIVDENNTEIGDRSFGSDAKKVSEMVKSLVSGLQSGGVSATLKHFPGHGSTVNNSHTGLSESGRELSQLRECEFLPFKAGIAAGVDFIMVSHMTLTNATKEKLPATMSKEVISDMLRGELGFEGIIITDAFNMGAITTIYSQSEAAVKAVKAGTDMILMPKNITEAHSAIVSAVESGEIPEERIKESVRRILTLKHKKGLI